MKILYTILLCGIVCLMHSCSKDNGSGGKHCWMVIDANGNDLVEICDKTRDQFLACVSNNSCGSFMVGINLTECQYYQSDGPTSCYTINGNTTPLLTQSQAALYAKCFHNGATAVKADCDGCESWFHRIKRQHKASGNFVFSVVTKEKFCGDTLATLFTGRQIIIKDDSDSLVVRQFSSNGINW